MRLKWLFLTGFIAAAASCGPTMPTTTTSAAPQTADVMETVDIASHSGQTLEAFSKSAGMERFALDKLDLSPEERSRVAHNMAVSYPSRLITGGGAQALVFTGCARSGCAAGIAVLAFGDHGETFVGVRDQGEAVEFIPDDRMEALLRLNSPTRRWDEVEPPNEATP